MVNKFAVMVFILVTFLLFMCKPSFGEEDEIYTKNVSALKSYSYQEATVLSKTHFYQNDVIGEGFCPSPTDSELYIKDNSMTLKGCPNDQVSCQLKSYLITGDHVLVVKKYKDYSCVWYPAKKKVTYGWIPNKFLKVLDPPASPNSSDAWLGKWKASNSELTFSKGNKPSQLIVNGNTQWVGEGKGNVNVGNLENETVTVNQNDAVYVNDPCRIYFKLANPNYLLVVDNNQCGGLNVSFGGVYTR